MLLFNGVYFFFSKMCPRETREELRITGTSVAVFTSFDSLSDKDSVPCCVGGMDSSSGIIKECL